MKISNKYVLLKVTSWKILGSELVKGGGAGGGCFTAGDELKDVLGANW